MSTLGRDRIRIAFDASKAAASVDVLTIEEMDASGALTRRYLANAVCDRVQSARLGVSTNHLYFIRGGKMLTTKPTS